MALSADAGTMLAMMEKEKRPRRTSATAFKDREKEALDS
jgi:hypothetical protein